MSYQEVITHCKHGNVYNFIANTNIVLSDCRDCIRERKPDNLYMTIPMCEVLVKDTTE
jgi:hypothetical protein